MANNGGKLIRYISAGYNIKSCTREGSRRQIKLQATLLKLFTPTLEFSDYEYREAMRQLIHHLIEAHKNGSRIEILMGHHGQEWVEWYDAHGRTRNKLALSMRTIQSLKDELMTTASDTEELPPSELPKNHNALSTAQ